jgi:hypothetical protein
MVLNGLSLNNFSYGNFSRFKLEFELKIRESSRVRI